MSNQQTTQCKKDSCTMIRTKYSPFCELCVEENPNSCLTCDEDCGTFKYCHTCALEEKRNYSGKYCKTCAKQSKDFMYCYACNMERKKNYKGRYCGCCNKPSNDYKFCYPCKMEMTV